MISAADLKRDSKGREASFYRWERWRQKEWVTWPRFTGRIGKRTAVFWILVKHLNHSHLQVNTASGHLNCQTSICGSRHCILCIWDVSSGPWLDIIACNLISDPPMQVWGPFACCATITLWCVLTFGLPKALERFILLLPRRSFPSPAVQSIPPLLLPTQNYCYGCHNSGI